MEGILGERKNLDFQFCTGHDLPINLFYYTLRTGHDTDGREIYK